MYLQTDTHLALNNFLYTRGKDDELSIVSLATVDRGKPT
jgi:hypothetical protein